MVRRLWASLVWIVVGCGNEPAPVVADAGGSCAPNERLVAGVGCVGAGVDDDGCAAGTLLTQEDVCKPAGIPPERCGSGFTADGAQGCTPVLPAAACAPGTMAVPGQTACTAIAACGSGTWGEIPDDTGRQHVDAGYTGGNSDGTTARPWTTIQQGVDAAEDGAIVAIAAGEYIEDVDIGFKLVRLWGRCPALVELIGIGPTLATIIVRSGAAGSVVRGLAISGPGIGLAVSGSIDVLAEELWIHDTAKQGIDVRDDLGTTSLTVRASLLEGVRGAGAVVRGAELAVRDSVVRDLALAGGYGYGLDVRSTVERRGVLRASGSLLERCTMASVLVLGADAFIDTSVVRETRTHATAGVARAIDARSEEPGARAHVEVSASVLDANASVGAFFGASDGLVDATLIRATSLGDDGYASAIVIDEHPETLEPSNVTLSWSLLSDNADGGVYVSGSEARLDGVIVRDTTPSADGNFGRGLQVDWSVSTKATCVIRGSAFERNRDVGILVGGGTFTLEGVLVTETAPRAADGLFGDALVASVGPIPTIVDVSASRMESSARAGVAAFGAQVTLKSTAMSCNAFDLNGETDAGSPFRFHDAGANVCGCAGVDEPCVATSSGLAPPLAAP